MQFLPTILRPLLFPQTNMPFLLPPSRQVRRGHSLRANEVCPPPPKKKKKDPNSGQSKRIIIDGMIELQYNPPSTPPVSPTASISNQVIGNIARLSGVPEFKKQTTSPPRPHSGLLGSGFAQYKNKREEVFIIPPKYVEASPPFFIFIFQSIIFSNFLPE